MTAVGPPSSSPISCARRAPRTSRSARPAATRSCTPTISTRRARRRSSCTGTTTCSRWTRIHEWVTAPFEPFIADGRVVGRGAADDKGQIQIHVRALEALLATRGGPAAQPPLRVRGRGGVVVRAPRRLARGQSPPAGRGPRGHLRHGLLRREPPGHHRRAAWCRRRRDPRAGRAPRPPLGSVRRDGAQPAQRALRDRGRPEGTGWPDPRPRLLRRRGAAHRRGSRRLRRAAVRRRGVPRVGRRARAVRRGRLHDARAARRATDAGPQRHLGRLPGRRRQDDHPRQRPREGDVPPGRGPGPGPDRRAAPRVRAARSRRPA